MVRITVSIALATVLALGLSSAEVSAQGQPEGQLNIAFDASIAPTFLDPAETWKEGADGLTYEFKLREGLKFHNGDPVTAEDVKFSFLRYRGASAKLLHD